MQRNQARQVALKALAKDPLVYQYDEVYDDMQQKKEEKKPPKEERKVSVNKVNENQFYCSKRSIFHSPSILATS